MGKVQWLKGTHSSIVWKSWARVSVIYSMILRLVQSIQSVVYIHLVQSVCWSPIYREKFGGVLHLFGVAAATDAHITRQRWTIPCKTPTRTSFHKPLAHGRKWQLLVFSYTSPMWSCACHGPRPYAECNHVNDLFCCFLSDAPENFQAINTHTTRNSSKIFPSIVSRFWQHRQSSARW